MNKKDILFYFLIFIVVSLSVYLIWFINTESYQCINKPLDYAASKIIYINPITKVQENFTCSCQPKATELLLDNSNILKLVK